MNHFLESRDGLSVAYNALPGRKPTVMFLPGFFSHMQGTKALWLEKCCRERGQAYVRFDYRGHGESAGMFEDGTVSGWLSDALLVLDRVAEKPVIVAGSSMGGWIALLMVFARPYCISGMVGIASSPDFTQSIWEERMNEDQRRKMIRKGFIRQPGKYREESVTISRELIEDGKKHLLLHREELDIDIPVCLIHGKKDTDIPWQKSLALQQKIGNEKCELILVPDGEHRLSRPKDLRLIDRKIQEISSLSSCSL